MNNRVGQQFGNYRLVYLIGRGGFAEDYLGEHVHLGTRAVVKVLHTQLANENVERFRNEARAVARLLHPNIVRVLDFGLHDATPFLVMDYAPYGTLRQRHPSGSVLPLPTIILYMKQVAEALQYAHQNRITHRDVKPENMLVGEHNKIMLSDFGIALMAQSSPQQSVQHAIGTVAYMAPEHIQGKPHYASDQYSLAAVVYEWLCGDQPFHGSFNEICTQHMYTTPPSLRQRVPALPPDVEQVLLLALAKDPNARFASMQAFANALEGAARLGASPQVNVAPGAYRPDQPAPPAYMDRAPSPGQLPPLTGAVPPPDQFSLPPTVQTPTVWTPPYQQMPPTTQMPPYQASSGAPPVSRLYHEAQTAQGQPFPQQEYRPPQTPQPPKKPNIGLVVMICLLVVALTGSGIFYFARGNNKSSNSNQSNKKATVTTTVRATSTSTGGITPIATSPNNVVPPPTGSAFIKIATDLPVSGKDESGGKPAENGAHLAVDQANANHTIPGYTLVFDPNDDVGPSGAHDPTVGAQNVTNLIGDALVAGIVGPFNSNVSKAELPITNQAPLAQISPSNTYPCLTTNTAASGCSGANDILATVRPTGKVTYFRVVTTDDHQGQAGANYAYKTLNLHKVWVIDDAEAYGVGLATGFITEFQADGGTVLGHSSEPGSTSNYVPLLTQIATQNPDAIYFGGVDSTGGTLIRQQMQQVSGLSNVPLVGGDGIVTPAFASTIGLNGGPAYGTVAVVDTTTSSGAAANFRSQYEAVYGNTLNVYSGAAYDCANILIQAIKTALINGAHTPQDSNDASGATVFRQAVINALQNISYDGLTGRQTFDANGDTANKIMSVYKLGPNNANTPDWIFTSLVQLS